MESHDRRLLPPGAPLPEGAADAGSAPSADVVGRLAATGRPVAVTLEPAEEGAGPDAGVLAAASVYAWLGVRILRAPEGWHGELAQVLDMVEAVRGERQPVLSRRGLA